MSNIYIGLYKSNGTRVSEGDNSSPLEPSDVLLIPNTGANESDVITATLKTAAGYKTYGNTTLKLINGNNTNNRWKLALNSSFTGQDWGQDLVIPSSVGSGGITIYAKARALGPVSSSFTTTNDMIDDDYSVDIQCNTIIIKA